MCTCCCLVLPHGAVLSWSWGEPSPLGHSRWKREERTYRQRARDKGSVKVIMRLLSSTPGLRREARKYRAWKQIEIKVKAETSVSSSIRHFASPR